MKQVFVLVLLVVIVNCADFKDVFNSGNSSAPQSQETIAQTHETMPDDAVVSAPSGDGTESGRAPITTSEGTYYFVMPQDTLTSIAAQYKVSGIALAHVNDMLYESSLPVGRRIFIPNKKKLAKYVDMKMLRNSLASADENKRIKDKSKSSGSTSSAKTSTAFIWPIQNPKVTSEYGMRKGRHHDGIDIGVPSGTPVLAVADGEVLFAEYFSSYGNLILLKHKNALFTVYAHNRKFLVSKGQKVKQGQTIAESGKTGRASGPHLHFEVQKKGGIKIDPLMMLPPLKK